MKHRNRLEALANESNLSFEQVRDEIVDHWFELSDKLRDNTIGGFLMSSTALMVANQLADQQTSLVARAEEGK